MTNLGRGKTANRENKCLFVQALEAGKHLKPLAGGIQAGVNISAENGLSNVFSRKKKNQYLKVNHRRDSDISAVSHEVKILNIQ